MFLIIDIKVYKMAIKKCVCSNDYQDKRYGYGMRVCNSKKAGGYRCSVCGRDVNKIGENDKKSTKTVKTK